MRCNRQQPLLQPWLPIANPANQAIRAGSMEIFRVPALSRGRRTGGRGEIGLLDTGEAD